MRILALIGSVAFAFCLGAGASTALAQNMTVEVTGQAAESGLGRATTRLRALEAALVEAAIMGGADVTGYSAASNGILVSDRLILRPASRILDYTILSETEVGGFYRVHAERGIDENLSAPGSAYVPLAFAESSHLPRRGEKPGASAPNRFYMYGVIARLAMVAASYELEATDPEAEVYA